MRSRRVIKRPALSYLHKRQRLEWCMVRRQWNLRTWRRVSSVHLRILEQPFYPIFTPFLPHFTSFFKARTTFQNSLKHLKQHRYIIQSLHHMIYSTNSYKSSQLNSISLKLFKEFSVISNIYI